MNPKSALGQLRRSAGFFSQEDAAKALGVSKIHVAQLERGAGGASKELLEKMARLYNVPLEELEALVTEGRKAQFERAISNLRTP